MSKSGLHHRYLGHSDHYLAFPSESIWSVPSKLSSCACCHLRWFRELCVQPGYSVLTDRLAFELHKISLKTGITYTLNLISRTSCRMFPGCCQHGRCMPRNPVPVLRCYSNDMKSAYKKGSDLHEINLIICFISRTSYRIMTVLNRQGRTGHWACRPNMITKKCVSIRQQR